MAGGRPPKFSNPEDMQAVIDVYFKELGENEIPTMAGLALELGMTSRALRDYTKKDEFLPTVKKARQRVEAAWEQSLIRGGGGAVFWMKNNANYRDKQETEVSGGLNITGITRSIVDAKDTED